MENKLTNMDISEAIYEGYKVYFNKYIDWGKDDTRHKLTEWLRLGQNQCYYDNLFDKELEAVEIVELMHIIRIEYNFEFDEFGRELMARILAIMGLYNDDLAERIVKYYT